MTFQAPTGELGQPIAYLQWTDAAGATQHFVADLVESEDWDEPATVTAHPVEKGANVTDHVRVELRAVKFRLFATNHPMGSNQWANAVWGRMDILGAQLPTPGTLSSLTVDTWQSNLDARVAATDAGGFLGNAIGGQAGGAIGAAIGAVAGALLLNGRVVQQTVGVKLGLPTPASPQSVSMKVLTMDTPGDYVAQTIALLQRLKDTAQTIDVIGSKTSCVGAAGIGGMVIHELSHHRGEDTGSGAGILLALTQFRVATTLYVPAPAASIPRAKKAVSKGNQGTNDAGGVASDAANAFVQGFKDGQTDLANLVSTP